MMSHSTIAKYVVRSRNSPFTLIVSSGSVVEFTYTPNPKSAAIVNAANEEMLGGGGVDGAISDAGGITLYEDRAKLPLLDMGIRCRTGSAVITGPGDYGTLGVPYVIHAVGPNYMEYNHDLTKGDILLSSAYRSSMDLARENKLEAVAFSLISSGIFRGRHSKKEVLRIGLNVIVQFEGYDELKEVHMCAFNSAEEELLCGICDELGLSV